MKAITLQSPIIPSFLVTQNITLSICVFDCAGTRVETTVAIWRCATSVVSNFHIGEPPDGRTAVTSKGGNSADPNIAVGEPPDDKPRAVVPKLVALSWICTKRCTVGVVDKKLFGKVETKTALLSTIAAANGMVPKLAPLNSS